MPTVTINGVSVEVAEGTNIVQAAEAAGIEIPHYCYHPGLSVAGNCRMCLVEIKALSGKQPNPLPKLQIACNTIVQDGMVVESDNPRVREARRAVLEFLLVNHPIDCPICDQAGECKLQEYYMEYGRHHSRVQLGDKVHKSKAIQIGPDIMLDQERCILCTRCIRFLEEVSESFELAITERGDRSRLTLAEGAWVDNPYAENIVDICPVGALTSREFRFRARVWYLDTADSICTGCATGCNIEVHSRQGVIYRVKPRYCPEVNGYWMCDAGRGLFRENSAPDRLASSLTREEGRFVDVEASVAAEFAARTLRAARSVAIVASASLSMEEGIVLAELARHLGGAQLLVISPETSNIPDDGKLISSDRYPNRRGLLALGFQAATGVPEGADGFLIVRCDPVAQDSGWAAALEAATATVLVSDRAGSTAPYADEVLAIASHFEQEGTFVNRHGRLQAYSAAIAPPGRAVPGWKALALLLEALGGPRLDSRKRLTDQAVSLTLAREDLDPGSLRPQPEPVESAA